MVLRRNGSNPVNQLRDEMDRLVWDFFAPLTATMPNRLGPVTRSFPALNAWEEGDALNLEAEVPGLKIEDLEISVLGNDLTLRGRRGPEPAEGTMYHRQERSFGEFNRVLRLPFDVDANRVEATLTHGVLTVKLPKAESAKPKRIQVKPAN